MPTTEEIERFLAALLAETRGCDWEGLAQRQPKRLSHLLAARFVYDVEKGGFAQLLFNMQGHLLEELEAMLVEANEKIARQHYVQAIEICLQSQDEYFRFLDSNFTESNVVKDQLHRVSIAYLAKRVAFVTEAASFLEEALRTPTS